MPEGTCYLAEEDLGAFIETMIRRGMVSQRAVDAYRLARLHLAGPVHVADLTDDGWAGAGLDAASTAGVDRAASQELALRLRQAGFGGVRWRLRRSMSGALIGVALFGEAGARGWDYASEPIPEELVKRAVRRFRLRYRP